MIFHILDLHRIEICPQRPNCGSQKNFSKFFEKFWSIEQNWSYQLPRSTWSWVSDEGTELLQIHRFIRDVIHCYQAALWAPSPALRQERQEPNLVPILRNFCLEKGSESLIWASGTVSAALDRFPSDADRGDFRLIWVKSDWRINRIRETIAPQSHF